MKTNNLKLMRVSNCKECKNDFVESDKISIKNQNICKKCKELLRFA
jgi:formylmethanofuran dehydrogenase subunit E